MGLTTKHPRASVPHSQQRTRQRHRINTFDVVQFVNRQQKVMEWRQRQCFHYNFAHNRGITSLLAHTTKGKYNAKLVGGDIHWSWRIFVLGPKTTKWQCDSSINSNSSTRTHVTEVKFFGFYYFGFDFVFSNSILVVIRQNKLIWPPINATIKIFLTVFVRFWTMNTGIRRFAYERSQAMFDRRTFSSFFFVSKWQT